MVILSTIQCERGQKNPEDQNASNEDTIKRKISELFSLSTVYSGSLPTRFVIEPKNMSLVLRRKIFPEIERFCKQLNGPSFSSWDEING